MGSAKINEKNFEDYVNESVENEISISQFNLRAGQAQRRVLKRVVSSDSVWGWFNIGSVSIGIGSLAALSVFVFFMASSFFTPSINKQELVDDLDFVVMQIDLDMESIHSSDFEFEGGVFYVEED